MPGYLVGEKYMNSVWYDGRADGDDESTYIGMDDTQSRCTWWPPVQDTKGFQDSSRFGSAPPSGCNMLYCDGRVDFVAYTVDGTVHRTAGNRWGPPRP